MLEVERKKTLERLREHRKVSRHMLGLCTRKERKVCGREKNALVAVKKTRLILMLLKVAHQAKHFASNIKSSQTLI